MGNQNTRLFKAERIRVFGVGEISADKNELVFAELVNIVFG